MDVPMPDIKDIYNCRFCTWECYLKKNVNTFLNTIKNHMKNKHTITLRKYEVINLVKQTKE